MPAHKPFSLLVVIALFADLRTAIGDDPPLPTIEAVRARVDESLGTIQSLDIKYRQTQFINPDNPFAKLEPPGVTPRTDHYDLEPQVYNWGSSGEKRFIYRPALLDVPKPTPTAHYAFDGLKVYGGYYESINDLDSKGLRRLHIRPGGSIDKAADQLTAHTPETWIGLRLNGTDDTLVSLVHAEESQIVGWERIDDHQCLHFRSPDCKKRNGDSLPAEFWLDPDKDWLPRQLTLLQSFPQVGLDIPFVQVVQEFQSLADPVANRRRWFPKRVESSFRLILRSEVLMASINTPVPESRFSIEPEVGTHVDDTTGSHPPYVFRGSDVPSPQRIPLDAEAASHQQATVVPLVDATPVPSGRHFMLVPWILGVVLAVWSLMIWRKR